jgi:cobalt/nickel transport system ATP-binding protein
MQSEIILLDEPTASLDPQNTDSLERILFELNSKGITVVISTHDVDFAYRVAQRVVVFAQGEVIADANTEEVFSSSEMLEKAGLRKPLLYEAYEIMQTDHSKLSNKKKPKTIEEFRRLFNK